MSAQEEILHLLQFVQSSDNRLRADAERALAGQWLNGGDAERRALLMATLAATAADGPADMRAAAAVIFRRFASQLADHSSSLGTMKSVFAVLPEVAQQSSKQSLLRGLLLPSQPAFARRKISDAVAEVAQHSGGWPELWPALATGSVENSDATVREACFRVLCGAPESLLVAENLPEVISVLSRGFEDSSEVVRASATAAFAAAFAVMPRQAWQLFKPLLPALLNVMEPLRVARKEEELTGVLESLITLVEVAPKMFQPVFLTLIQFALNIASDKEFDEAPRMTALELAVEFSDGAPLMCARCPQYVQQLVPVLLHMLTEIGVGDEDGSQWEETDDIEVVEEEELVHREAKLALDRISLNLGGTQVAPALFEYLPHLLTSQEWRERVAGLMALSNAAEGCRDEMLQNITTILQSVEPLLTDVHPRVQWSACNALGQLSTDLAPALQLRFPDLVLRGLIGRLSAPSFKVQAHAAAALVNFSDNVAKEVLEPYLTSLVEALLQLVRSPKRYVQEQALTTIAMVADSCQQHFAKYYSELMPLVLEIITTDLPPEYSLLKAKAIECATLIALAVGPETFEPHRQQLCDSLVAVQLRCNQLRASGSGEIDPCEAYLLQSWGRLCRVIKEKFEPYLKLVIPFLLEAATARAEVQILDSERADNLRESEGWEVVRYNGQWVGVHTEMFEEKANAIELLNVYPRELGVLFNPYVNELVEKVVMPGISFYYSDRVRVYSCQLIVHLLYVAHLSDPASALALWQQLFSALMELLANPRDSQTMHAETLLSICHALEILGTQAFTKESINQLAKVLVGRLVDLRHRLELETPAGGPQSSSQSPHPSASNQQDEDEFEEGYDSDEDEEGRADGELVDAANRLIHAMLKAYGSALLDTEMANVLALVPVFAASPAPDCELFAVEAIGDLAEFCKDRPLQWGDIPLTLAQSPHASLPVRGAAIACLGRLALNAGPAFGQQALAALHPLLAFSSADAELRERSCGTVARILRTYGPQALSPQDFQLAVTEWLKLLPITNIAEGASYSYLFLAELMEKNSPSVAQHYQRAFLSVVAALEAGTLAEKPAKYVVEQTKHLLSSLSEEQRMSLLKELSPTQLELVKMVFS